MIRQPKRGEIEWEKLDDEVYRIWNSRSYEPDGLKPITRTRLPKWCFESEDDYCPEREQLGKMAVSMLTTILPHEAEALIRVSLLGQTQKECGMSMQKSTQRIEQIYQKALIKMRMRFYNLLLKTY